MTPVFQPFEGELYESAELRLLVVGESHYGAPETERSNFTRDVVEYWSERVEPMRFLDNVASLLKADDSLPTGRELDAAAFYNFVQFSMASASERPTRDQLIASASCFPGVLARLAPTNVLVAGRTQWSYLPPFDIDLGRPDLGGRSMELGAYATPRGRALAISIPHPSWRFFSVSPWRGVVQAFLAMDSALVSKTRQPTAPAGRAA